MDYSITKNLSPKIGHKKKAPAAKSVSTSQQQSPHLSSGHTPVKQNLSTTSSAQRPKSPHFHHVERQNTPVKPVSIDSQHMYYNNSATIHGSSSQHKSYFSRAAQPIKTRLQDRFKHQHSTTSDDYSIYSSSDRKHPQNEQRPYKSPGGVSHFSETPFNLDTSELLLKTFDPFSLEEPNSPYSSGHQTTGASDDPFADPQFLTGLPGVQEIFAIPRDDSIIQNFMRLHSCYDLIPTSGKLIIFDTNLPVKKAFFALVYNGVRAAPLWDSTTQSFVGMLTITDFINVLRTLNKKKQTENNNQNTHDAQISGDTNITNSANTKLNDHNIISSKNNIHNHHSALKTETSTDTNEPSDNPAKTVPPPLNLNPVITVDNLEEHKIQTWRDEFLREHCRPFLWVDPRVNLLRAARLLVKNRVHRLPVVDPLTGNALYILTHKRILRFLCLYMDDLTPRPKFMDKTLEELDIGTYENVQTVYEDTPIGHALDLFAEKRISALPVLKHSDNRVIDVYAKFDVINLAAERSYRQLDVSVREALGYRSHIIEEVHSCQKGEKLGAVIDRIVKAGVHRLVVVDEHWKCVGMLSLSDILSFLIKPLPTEIALGESDDNLTTNTMLKHPRVYY